MTVRNRQGITIAILIVVLVFAGAVTLSTVGAGAQETNETESNVTITVGATGTTSAAPDLAVINIAVESSADSADAARGQVADNVTEMREALTEANISDDQIRTTYYYIQTERDDNGTVTYRAVHGFELRVPVDNAGSVVDTAIAGGATHVDGVQFTLTEETSRELRSEALESALDNARADADVIASATGVEVQTVKSVQTGDGGIGPVFAGDGSRDETVFDPGPVTVTAHVTVTYEAS
ncbi:SIMPL domain-containing protein [Halorubrum sp. HHNYT27]|uniref:SIMPL domain-containing protein n=1 Tax=Halorubrum sp. HHNYT27 TaxID=3402275 RepID=UPI003EBD5144